MSIDDYAVTNHAWSRMTARAITKKNVEAVLKWGKKVYLRGAKVFVLGEKEIKKVLKISNEKLNTLNGIQVVCSTNEKVILTVYKNRDFKKSLKENRGFGYYNL